MNFSQKESEFKHRYRDEAAKSYQNILPYMANFETPAKKYDIKTKTKIYLIFSDAAGIIVV